MPLKNITMLTRLDTAELSLVKRGANKKVYAITKSEDPMSVKAVISTPAQGEDKLVATLKNAGASEDRIEAAVAQYRLQKGFADVLDAGDLEIVAKAAGVKIAKAKKAADDEEDDEDDDMPPQFKKKTKKSAPDLSQLSPEMQEQVQAIFKSNEQLASKCEKLEAITKSLIDDAATKDYVAKAEKLTHIPGKPAEVAQILKSAHDASPALAEGLEKLLGSMNEVIAKSALLGTAGSSGSTHDTGMSGSAWTKLQALADGLVQKSDDGSMTSEKAMTIVMKSAAGKALYKEYLAENPAQRAKNNFA